MVSRCARVLAAALVVVALAAGCGSSSKSGTTDTTAKPSKSARGEVGATPASTWTGKACETFTGWFDDLQHAMGPPSSTPSDAEGIKKLVLDVLDNAIAATDDAAAQLREAGTPDVENGAAVAKSLADLITSFGTVLKDGRDEFSQLATNDKTELQNKGQEVLNRVGERLNALQPDVASNFTSADFERAYKSEPACASLQ